MELTLLDTTLEEELDEDKDDDTDEATLDVGVLVIVEEGISEVAVLPSSTDVVIEVLVDVDDVDKLGNGISQEASKNVSKGIKIQEDGFLLCMIVFYHLSSRLIYYISMKLTSILKENQSLIGLIILSILLLSITQVPTLADLWVRSVARLYHISLGWVISFIPFSLMELVFIGWIIWMVTLVIQAVRYLLTHQPLRGWRAIRQGLIVFLTMGNLYLATAGIAYARHPLPIPQFDGQVDYTDYVPVIEHYRDRFNHVASQLQFRDDGSVINPYSIAELNDKIHQAFNQANLDASYFTPYSVRIKPLLTSFLYREFQITGVHFAPSTEATINTLIPDALIPFTMAHELAHAKGVMREEDANLIALYVTIQSDDPYVQYSGFFNTFYALLNLSRFIGNDQAYGQLVQTLSQPIRKDYQFQGEFWANHDILDDFARWVNDTYLRLFGNEGVSSYVDVPVITVVQDGENTIEMISEYSPYQQLFFYWYFTSSV